MLLKNKSALKKYIKNEIINKYSKNGTRGFKFKKGKKCFDTLIDFLKRHPDAEFIDFEAITHFEIIQNSIRPIYDSIGYFANGKLHRFSYTKCVSQRRTTLNRMKSKAFRHSIAYQIINWKKANMKGCCSNCGNTNEIH